LHVARLRQFQLEAELDVVQEILGDAGPEDSGVIVAQAKELLREIGDVQQSLERLNERSVRFGMLVQPQGTMDHDSGRR
jgi:hypothetical protein